jgi:hypothetical protein
MREIVQEICVVRLNKCSNICSLFERGSIVGGHDDPCSGASKSLNRFVLFVRGRPYKSPTMDKKANSQSPIPAFSPLAAAPVHP